MAGFSTTVYNALFKRTSTFALTVAVSAFFFERTFELISESMFNSMNKGKLWKDIKHNSITSNIKEFYTQKKLLEATLPFYAQSAYWLRKLCDRIHKVSLFHPKHYKFLLWHLRLLKMMARSNYYGFDENRQIFCEESHSYWGVQKMEEDEDWQHPASHQTELDQTQNQHQMKILENMNFSSTQISMAEHSSFWESWDSTRSPESLPPKTGTLPTRAQINLRVKRQES
ncbi:hypothetical protein J437_LFUL013398 [Ladona fulva]|uniref:Cytochrome b-c1 complex subunit 9 n=1 Tax=Ladona fulva TaxID=123851 RepID=A0A8K0P2H5_LADFU|nr:hypothetical protein J437_LFUL013398 [Ladona fulva]